MEWTSRQLEGVQVGYTTVIGFIGILSCACQTRNMHLPTHSESCPFDATNLFAMSLFIPEGLIQKQDPKDALLCRAW